MKTKIDEVVLEKFKTEKPVVSKSSVRLLLGKKGEIDEECRWWVQRWMTQLVRERSLPPQLSGKDAFVALSRFLTPSDALDVLERIRREYAESHPLEDHQTKEELEWLATAVSQDTLLSSQDHLLPRVC